MAKRTLTAEGVQSVRIPSSIPFKIEETEHGLLLVTGESDHTHELLLKLLEQAEKPRHDKGAPEILVEAKKIVRGGTTILEVHPDGLKLVGCPMHPFKFIRSGIVQNRIAFEKIMFDPKHKWNPAFDPYDLQTGELIWDESGENAQYQQPQKDQQPRIIASLSVK